MLDAFGCALERIEAGHEYVRKQEKASTAGIVFMEAAEDAAGEELAEGSTCVADALVDSVGLLALELKTVGKEAVDC